MTLPADPSGFHSEKKVCEPCTAVCCGVGLPLLSGLLTYGLTNDVRFSAVIAALGFVVDVAGTIGICCLEKEANSGPSYSPLNQV